MKITLCILSTLAVGLVAYALLNHTSGDPVSSAWKAVIACIAWVAVLLAWRLDSQANEAKPIRFAPGNPSDRA